MYLKGLRALNYNRARETFAMELSAEGQSISLLTHAQTHMFTFKHEHIDLFTQKYSLELPNKT